MRRAVFLAVLVFVTACAGLRPSTSSDAPRTISRLALVGEFSIPSLGRFPVVAGLRFGGISGLARIADGAELLGVSDEHVGARVYRMQVEHRTGTFTVAPVDVIYLESNPGAPARLDLEGLAVLENGNILVASEGYGSQEPRVPPALIEYSKYGTFVRRLEVRPRFIPAATGPLVQGVRANAAFESLTISPDGSRLFTATESALVQDGEAATFERGSAARILEYVRRDETYVPGREFAYDIDPIQKESFEPGAAINGLVELLALSRTELLALERSYVADAARQREGANRIRLYRVSLAGAVDVSRLDSLRDASSVAVPKTLLLDLSTVDGLNAGLPRLENFEGMAFGPRLADGRSTVILVSDDNFSSTQRTSFLMFAIEP